MSDNYFFYSGTNLIECFTYRALYQLLRQMYKHHFYCTAEIIKGNIRFIYLHKRETKIILCAYNQMREPITGTRITYNDYIQKVVKRHETNRKTF